MSENSNNLDKVLEQLMEKVGDKVFELGEKGVLYMQEHEAEIESFYKREEDEKNKINVITDVNTTGLISLYQRMSKELDELCNRVNQ